MSGIDHKDAATRKAHPIFSGVLAYFPDALLAVAELSRIGNDKHNAGQPLHWSRGKSNDHADCLVRHQLDAGKWDTIDTPAGPIKVRHSAAVAWRALAQLQLEIEAGEPAITTEYAPKYLFLRAFAPHAMKDERVKQRRVVPCDWATCPTPKPWTKRGDNGRCTPNGVAGRRLDDMAKS